MRTSQGEDRYAFLVLVAATLLLGLAGYAGYVLYPRFDLPAMTGAGLAALAAAAGVAVFFSPCSFPLLLTLLVREIRQEDRGTWGRSIRFGLALAAGAGVFLAVIGGAVALGTGNLFEEVTFASAGGRAIRAVVGVLLATLGLIQLGMIPVTFHAVSDLATPLLRRQAALQRWHPHAAFFLFGFGYLIAGFG